MVEADRRRDRREGTGEVAVLLPAYPQALEGKEGGIALALGDAQPVAQHLRKTFQDPAAPGGRIMFTRAPCSAALKPAVEVRKGGFSKSNISKGAVALASRPDNAGRPKRASMKRVIEVWS